MSTQPHVPVLLQEIIFWLRPNSQGCYVDCTLGPGGAALRILELSQPGGRLIGIDQDPTAISLARRTLGLFLPRVQLVCRNFVDLKSILASAGSGKADGILFDLGISSDQLANPNRGFSFLEEGSLDMRLSPLAGPTAGDLVNTMPEAELASLIFRYGEERYARRIAKAVVRERGRFPVRTTTQLTTIIRASVPHSYRRGRLHCATRTFQALRIAVNQELEVLQRALYEAVDVLAPKGRLCVISFHSLEDRIVKQTFRALSQKPTPTLKILTKKPCVPSREERSVNPRSRSGKLRVAERLCEWEAGKADT